MDTSTDLTPQQIGSYWAVPTIDSTDNSQVEVQVSVSISSGDDALNGSDVGASAIADGTALAQLSAPDPSSPLPTIETRAMTAYAIFTFDNPQNLTVTSIAVTVRDQTVTFGTPSDSSSLPVA